MATPVTKVTHVGGARAGAGSPTVSEETIGGWSFRSVSAPIASSARIEEVEAALSLPHGVPVPEACFADNSLTIRHDASGTELRINAVDALRSWHSRQSRIAADAGGVVCATSFDWAYENEYDGLLVRGPGAEAVPMEDSPRGLPMELLRLREDIVWSCHLSLYEDDLHDMGVVECTVKARVMASCFFVLLETFVRIDGERTALRQARFCHEFGSTSVLRDVEVRSASAQEVVGSGRPTGAPLGMTAAAGVPPVALAAGVVSHATARPLPEETALPAAVASEAETTTALSTSPFAPKPEQKRARATGFRLAYDALRVRAAVEPKEHRVERAALA
ncbi:hypothetical protein FNF27_05793 [Cafeteria roenbergensis]|uniref:TIP41-like protein n=1 Tax=Cafeteria roenbergensis TaxID=33653 RepID=A0A5A8E4R7_CAFRO|nr:hypothetical protein FNF27_05793 [Cafeteria roenbergensis]